MNITVITKQYKELRLREREILRYAGCKTEEAEVVRLMQSCLQEAERAEALQGKLCYAELPFRAEVSAEKNTVCDFGSFSVCSEQLKKNLQDCNKVLLLAATAGVGIDRLISKYGRIAPSKALMFQAIGAELVEAICDTFGREYEAERACTLCPRFSPGYGDLPLETQKDVFRVLDPAKRIGLTLNDSLLMSPSKSVTAFAGVENGVSGSEEKKKNEKQKACKNCEQKDCMYRGE